MIDLSKNVVYLAAPKRLYQSHLFANAYAYLMPKTAALLDPRGMYKSNAEWLANYETRLSIADTMVIVSDDLMVGKGVYTEYNYFWRRNCKVYHLLQYTNVYQLVAVKRIKVIDDDDWSNYATIQYR
jgi:hypothetical protein